MSHWVPWLGSLAELWLPIWSAQGDSDNPQNSRSLRSRYDNVCFPREYTTPAVCLLAFGAMVGSGFDHIISLRMTLLRSLSEGPRLGLPRTEPSALVNWRLLDVSLPPPAIQTHQKAMIDWPQLVLASHQGSGDRRMMWSPNLAPPPNFA